MQIEIARTSNAATIQNGSRGGNTTIINRIKEIFHDNFGDQAQSAKVYALEKSPYASVYENLEFDHPFESCDFIQQEQFEALLQNPGDDPDILMIPFGEYDLIVEIKFGSLISDLKIDYDPVRAFADDFRRYLHDLIKEYYGILAIMNRLNQTMLGCLDLETIFSSVAIELKSLIDYDRISIATYHPQYNSFRIEAVYESENDDFNFMKQYLRTDGCNLGRLIEGREVMIYDLRNEGKGHIANQLLHKGYQSILLYPILDKGEIVASLHFGSKKENAFGKGVLRILEKVCALIGRSIAAARIYAEQKNLMNDYNDAQEMFLHTERYRNFIDITRGVLHAFNNHLALIMGRAQLLGMFSGDVVEKDKLDKGLDIILKATNAASDQISMLQKYARTREQEEPDQIQVKGLVEEIIKLSLPRWKAVGRGAVEVEYNISSHVHFIGNRKRIRDALINILMNAVESEQNTGGKVLIEAETKDEVTSIAIIDSGIGMSSDEINKAFDPFFSTKENGTGLGLSVSYRIIREHRGDIIIESTPGKGTTVRIDIPNVYHGSRSFGQQDEIGFVSKAVIIDQQKIHRNLLSRLLEGLGVTTECCSNLSEAKQIIKEYNPDLVIWDDNVMDCAPAEFVEKVHTCKKNVFTCMVGSQFDYIDKHRFQRIGIDTLMGKPYEKSQIISMLNYFQDQIGNE